MCYNQDNLNKYIRYHGGIIMKNLVSRNELATWEWDEKVTGEEKYDQVTEYFQCITECDIPDHEAKRFCRYILTT